MSHPDGSSLLDFLDSPVIVGDPDSRVIYLNPSCERRLGVTSDQARGETLSSLFEGGSRESVLKAVAEVCTHGQTSHFKLRESGYHYLAQASPIEAEGDSVGVVILLTDEPLSSSRPAGLSPQVAESLEETIACLQQLAAAASDPDVSDVIERGLGGLGQLQKLGNASTSELAPRAKAAAKATLDPVRVARQAAELVGREFSGAGCDLDLLLPQQLPAARGDEETVKGMLVGLLRDGVREAGQNSHFTLSARLIGGPGRRVLLYSVVHLRGSDAEPGVVAAESVARKIRDRAEGLGGLLYTVANENFGRVTSIQLPLAG